MICMFAQAINVFKLTYAALLISAPLYEADTGFFSSALSVYSGKFEGGLFRHFEIGERKTRRA